jgi:putative aldouronate transport system permease protein
MERNNQTRKNRKTVPSLAASYWKHRYLFVLFIPAIVYYGIFRYGPLYGIQIAFKDFIFRRGITGSPWVGMENFKLLFSMGSFKEVLRNTVIISFLKLVFGFPAPIVFAILLNEIRALKYKKFIQTVSYLPHFVSWVILGGVFMQFLSPSTGPVNIILQNLGIKPIYFLASEIWFRPVLVITSIWKGVGWGSIIYLASISGIDPELYEAAEIDGAGRLRKAISITVPSLVPVITIMMIFSIGGIIQDDFDQIFNLYNPAVYKVGDVLSTYNYRVGLVEMKYSFSAAVGLFTNIISFVLILITNSITKRVNEYGLW